MENRKVFSSELALVIGLVLNSFAIPLMSHSGYGISTISSLAFVLSHAFPAFTFGEWNYIFQTALIGVLLLITKKFKWSYIFAFLMSVVFGILLDIFRPLILLMPNDVLILKIAYYLISFGVLGFGISLLVMCALPILPTDFFPKDIAKFFNIEFKYTKTGFDLICLVCTVIVSLTKFGSIMGVGVGTVFYAICTGKMVSVFIEILSKRFYFQPKFERLSFFTAENTK